MPDNKKRQNDTAIQWDITLHFAGMFHARLFRAPKGVFYKSVPLERDPNGSIREHQGFGDADAQNSKDDIAHTDRTSRDAGPNAIGLFTVSAWILWLSAIKPQESRYPFLRRWFMPMNIKLCMEINEAGIPFVRERVS